MAAKTGLIDRARAVLLSGEATDTAGLARVLGIDRVRAKNAFYNVRKSPVTPPEIARVPPPPPSAVRLRVVQSDESDAAPLEAGPAFEPCYAAGGLRRDDCERYGECLDAAVRGIARDDHGPHVRCPAACAWYRAADRSREFAHLSASRPGGGCSYPEGGL